jgi:hypothetical protein
LIWEKGERSISAALLGFLARIIGDRKAVNYRWLPIGEKNKGAADGLACLWRRKGLAREDWRPVGGEIDVLVPTGVDLSHFEHEMSFVEAVLVSTCVVAGSQKTTSVYYQAGEHACADASEVNQISANGNSTLCTSVIVPGSGYHVQSLSQVVQIHTTRE